MNATALLSRMFDRWYRRQIARQHLLGQVRLVGRRSAGKASAPASSVTLHRAARTGRPVSDVRREV